MSPSTPDREGTREPRAAEVLPFPRADWERDVNALKGKLDEGLVTTDHEARTCWHTYSQVNERARTLTCRDCGAALDPIDVLAEVARRRESLVFELRHLAGERKRMREEVKRLKRAEQNAKARVRSARARALALDRTALEAAAEAALQEPGVTAYMYRGWDGLSADQRVVVVNYVARIVELYGGALERQESDESAVG